MLSQNEVNFLGGECDQIRNEIRDYFKAEVTNRERMNVEVMNMISKFGFELYSRVFRHAIHDLFVKLDGISEFLYNENQTRMYFCSFDPVLQDFPWEFLKMKKTGSFVCLKHYIIRLVPLEDTFMKVNVLRYDSSLSLVRKTLPNNFTRPIKILVIAANPLNDLNLSEEISKMKKILEELKEELSPELSISVDILESPKATIENIVEKSEDAQIMHFCGHGFFGDNADSGLLVDLSNKDSELNEALIYDNKAVILKPELYKRLFESNKNLRLVILNACLTARGSCSMETTTGIAPTLIKIGIPYVIAMQFRISDVAGITFSKSFYKHLKRMPTISIEELMLKVREALRRNQYIEPFAFLSPVLYTRLVE